MSACRTITARSKLGCAPLGNVQIDNRNGDIQLSSARQGRIPSRCPHSRRRNSIGLSRIEGQQRRTRSQCQRQRGQCLSHIVINNEHDGIEIRKAQCATPAVAPVPPEPAKPGKALPAPKEQVATHG